MWLSMQLLGGVVRPLVMSRSKALMGSINKADLQISFVLSLTLIYKNI